MKVKCINNDMAEKYLTVGKEYDVIGVTMQNYVVINNNGNEGGWDVSRFVEEHEQPSHHNTTNLKGAALDKAESKAKSQEKEILELFNGHSDTWTASEIWAKYYDMEVLLTSVRRALSNLANPKKYDKLIKTNEKKIGYYGSPEHYYKLK